MLVILDKSRDESLVDNLGSVEVGQKKPDKEGKSKPVPVGDEVENEAEEGLSDIEDTKDHPVSEPDLVIDTTIVGLECAN